ncbi:MAG: hypothetical protein K0R85_398 [Devosia sp.]|jgi:hypothetical protein|nr:hypothetical protein [Devosia sp.]
MTGYISAVIGDRIEVLSDTAVYDAQGILLYTKPKVKRLDHHRAVVMTRGMVDAGEEVEDLVRSAFERAGSFDVAMSRLSAVLAEMGSETAQPIEATICGISEARGPVLAYFLSMDWGDGPAWQLHWAYTMLMGVKVADPAITRRLTTSGTLADKGVFLMEELRSSPGKSVSFGNAADANVVVGGDVELTTISWAGVETHTLHNWPDKIGEVLVARPSQHHRPSWQAYTRGAAAIRAVPEAEPATGMNRQQRRAAEREAQRRRA